MTEFGAIHRELELSGPIDPNAEEKPQNYFTDDNSYPTSNNSNNYEQSDELSEDGYDDDDHPAREIALPNPPLTSNSDTDTDDGYGGLGMDRNHNNPYTPDRNDENRDIPQEYRGRMWRNWQADLVDSDDNWD